MLQLDNNAWMMLILNLSLLLAVSWISFRLVTRNSSSVKLANTCISECQIASTSTERLPFKKYLIVRRQIKIDSDDDPPYSAS